MPLWLKNILGILLLLVTIAAVFFRLPKIDLGHSEAFKKRRLWNWIPLGLTYSFLYFGRYNLGALQATLDKLGLLSKQEFGDIDGWGAAVYGVAFLLNGPLTDRWGGRVTILLASGGSALINVAFGLVLSRAQAGAMDHAMVVKVMTVLCSANMYFQSFGAVSIVKVNAPWFHVRERGMLGGLFGILISLGLYFAYDVSRLIAEGFGMTSAFYIPAALLLTFFVIDFFVIRDTPGQAGFNDFDTGDASSGETGEPLGVVAVAKRMFSQKVIWIIVAVEFCSGFLRQSVMKWYLGFAKATGGEGFVSTNWGVLLCVAGITGGVFAGFISDHVFESRRGPVASVLYGGLTAGAVIAYFTLGTSMLGWAAVFMSLCVIGVHGMLSGTASMDFGGKKNAGVVTGIIDGFVYLGSAAQAFLYARILPGKEAAKDPANWKNWPLAMIPVAIVGLILATRVWNARPRPASQDTAKKPEPAPAH